MFKIHMRLIFSIVVISTVAVLYGQSKEILHIQTHLQTGCKLEQQKGSRIQIIEDTERKSWLASDSVSFLLIPPPADLKQGRLGFWFNSLIALSDSATIVSMGDFPKQFTTLRITLKSNGAVTANHLSYHNKSKWLEGVVSLPGSIEPGRWHYIEYSWGKAGQSLYIDGDMVDIAPGQTMSISWPRKIRFHMGSFVFAYVRLSDTIQQESILLKRPDIDIHKELGDEVLGLQQVLQKLETIETELESLKLVYGNMPYEYSRFKILNIFARRLFTWAVSVSRPEDSPLELDAVQRGDYRWILEQVPLLQEHLNGISSGAITPLKSPEIIPDVDMIEVRDGSFWQADRPVYLIGIQSPDFSLISGLGFSVTGHTTGPKWEMPEEGKLGRTGVGMRKRAKAAEDNGFFWDVLYSAHAASGWYIKKHPELKVGCGFMKHDGLSSNGWKMHEITLNSFLQDFTNASNFLTLDLMNEPAFNGKTVDATEKWRKWLKKQHGVIALLNSAWRSDYRNFDDIDVPDFVNRKHVAPGRQHFPSDPDILPVYVDWSRFNCERVVDWFSKIQDISKHYVPKTLTYTKIIQSPTMNAHMGIDIIANARLTDLNGSDAWWVYRGMTGEAVGGDAMSGVLTADNFVVNWQTSLMYYDILHSAKPSAPIVNGEDHLFAGSFQVLSDNNPDVAPGHTDKFIPGEHFYASQWQQAIHGKGMTLVWTHWPQNNVTQRAIALDALSRVALDLNRLSLQVHELSSVKPKVGLLYSFSSMLWFHNQSWFDKIKEKPGFRPWAVGDTHISNNKKIWMSLMLNGTPVEFVFERDLADGIIPDVDMLIVRSVKQISPNAVDSLKKAVAQGMKLKVFDDGSLENDSYNRPLKTHIEGDSIQLQQFNADPMGFTGKLLKDNGLEPGVRVKNMDDTLCSMVEWRMVEAEGKILINLCSYSPKPIKIKIDGELVKYTDAVDLINQEKLNMHEIALAPEQVRLLEISTLDIQ